MNDFDPNFFDTPARMNEANRVMKRIPSIKALDYLQATIAMYLHTRECAKHDPTYESTLSGMETVFRMGGIDIKRYL